MDEKGTKKHPDAKIMLKLKDDRADSNNNCLTIIAQLCSTIRH